MNQSIQSKSIFMKNIDFFAWRSLPCIRARIVPLRRFRFARRVRANRNVSTTLGFFVKHVNVSGQVCVRNVRMRANEALISIAEHHFLHVRGFHATAIVIKRDCGLWHGSL